MSVHGQSQSVRAERFDRVDPVWQRLREEAEDVIRREGELGGFIFAAILNHGSLEAAVAHRVARGCTTMLCRAISSSRPIATRSQRSCDRRGLPRRHWP